jgi:hypothetical protein
MPHTLSRHYTATQPPTLSHAHTATLTLPLTLPHAHTATHCHTLSHTATHCPTTNACTTHTHCHMPTLRHTHCRHVIGPALLQSEICRLINCLCAVFLVVCNITSWQWLMGTNVVNAQQSKHLVSTRHSVTVLKQQPLKMMCRYRAPPSPYTFVCVCACAFMCDVHMCVHVCVVLVISDPTGPIMSTGPSAQFED